MSHCALDAGSVEATGKQSPKPINRPPHPPGKTVKLLEAIDSDGKPRNHLLLAIKVFI